MLSPKMFDVVVNSILEDRNCSKGKILNRAESEKHIVIKVRDKGDEMVIKRDVKEALMIYWNVVIAEEQKVFISTHCITFSDFRLEFEEVVEKVEGNADIDECILEALERAAEKRVTKNLSRVQKSHNSKKKKDEIHGKEEGEQQEDQEDNEKEKETLQELPQPNEPLGIEPPAEPTEPVEAEKVEDEIEDAEIVEDDFKIVRDGEIEGLEDIEIKEEKQEDEGIKAAEEFLKKQKTKKKAGRPKKNQQKGV